MTVEKAEPLQLIIDRDGTRVSIANGYRQGPVSRHASAERMASRITP